MKKIFVSILFLPILSLWSQLCAQDSSVKVSLPEDAVAYGSSSVFSFSFENTSDVEINDLTYAFCIGDGSVDSLHVNFPSALKPEKTSVKEFRLSMQDAVLGKNEIQLWCVSMNESAVESDEYDTVSFSFTYYDSTLVSPYTPLVELFSSSNCSHCKPFNDGVNPSLEELVGLGYLNVVKYQVNAPSTDPYATLSGANRMDYYGVSGAPTCIYAGTEDVIGWGPYPEFDKMMNTLRNKVYSEYGALCMVNVNLVDFTIDTVDHYLNLEFNLGAMEDMSVLVNAVVVEKNTYKNAAGNGEKEFHWINMDIPTNVGKGIVVNLEEGKCTDNFHYQVNLAETHTEEDSDLQVVFIIQMTAGTVVYQSLRFQPEFGDVEYDPSLSVAEPVETLTIELYPNPVSDMLQVRGISSAEVSVFDLSGRCVFPSRTFEGDFSISVADFVPGVYVLRVAQDGKVGIRRFLVVR